MGVGETAELLRARGIKPWATWMSLARVAHDLRADRFELADGGAEAVFTVRDARYSAPIVGMPREGVERLRPPPDCDRWACMTIRSEGGDRWSTRVTCDHAAGEAHSFRPGRGFRLVEQLVCGRLLEVADHSVALVDLDGSSTTFVAFDLFNGRANVDPVRLRNGSWVSFFGGELRCVDVDHAVSEPFSRAKLIWDLSPGLHDDEVIGTGLAPRRFLFWSWKAHTIVGVRGGQDAGIEWLPASWTRTVMPWFARYAASSDVLAVSESDRRLAAGRRSGRPTLVLDDVSFPHVSLTEDGALLAVERRGRTFVMEVRTAAVVAELNVRVPSISPDGRWLAGYLEDGLAVFDLQRPNVSSELVLLGADWKVARSRSWARSPCWCHDSTSFVAELCNPPADHPTHFVVVDLVRNHVLVRHRTPRTALVSGTGLVLSCAGLGNAMRTATGGR